MTDLPPLGVKMCGNCNPDISSMAVARRVAASLGVRLVPYGEAAVRLTISACGSACVEAAWPAPALIRGLSLNGAPCRGEDELVRRTVELLRPFLERQPKFV